MELYFAMVNILDFLALHEEIENTPNNFYGTLTYLAAKYVEIGEGTNIKEVIADIADANNAAGCSSWAEIVADFREQFKTGDRVAIR